MAMSVGSGGVAVSETIGDQTTCAEVDAVLDAKPLDYERAAEIYSRCPRTLRHSQRNASDHGDRGLRKDKDRTGRFFRVDC
jgi:hypothetical protein